MVCRNAARAEAARVKIVEETQVDTARVRCLIADCGVEADVRGMWDEFAQQQGADVSTRARRQLRVTSASIVSDRFCL